MVRPSRFTMPTFGAYQEMTSLLVSVSLADFEVGFFGWVTFSESHGRSKSDHRHSQNGGLNTAQ